MPRLPALLLLTASQLVWAASPAPDSLDPGLWAAASTGGFRALAFRECSPEHCWTRLYIQAEVPESAPIQFRCTSEVKELGYGSFITELSWNPPSADTSAGARLEAKVLPSHGGFEPYEATITVDNDCGYEVVPPRPAV